MDDDDINPNGCALGVLIAGFLWVIILVVAALVVNIIARST